MAMAWTKTEGLKQHIDDMATQWRTKGVLAIGKENLISHFEGKRLTKQEAINAHCYECMGGHSDGLSRDCENPPCPLYPYMPYNPNKVKREVSEEQQKALSEARKKSRIVKATQREKA